MIASSVNQRAKFNTRIALELPPLSKIEQDNEYELHVCIPPQQVFETMKAVLVSLQVPVARWNEYKIHCIRALRIAYNLGFKDTKELYEDIERWAVKEMLT